MICRCRASHSNCRRPLRFDSSAIVPKLSSSKAHRASLGCHTIDQALIEVPRRHVQIVILSLLRMWRDLILLGPACRNSENSGRKAKRVQKLCGGCHATTGVLARALLSCNTSTLSATGPYSTLNTKWSSVWITYGILLHMALDHVLVRSKYSGSKPSAKAQDLK